MRGDNHEKNSTGDGGPGVARPGALLSTGVQAANLVQNGGFETNTLPTLNPANASGAEVDNNWHYGNDLPGWTSPGASTYNILFFGNVANASSIDADTRFTASEPQHLNSNFNSLSPNGGSFMGLDGDPAANGQLEQTIMGLTSGQKYTLSFDWAGIELSNRTGYDLIQLTGSFGSDPFQTLTYLNSASAGQPGSFSGWMNASFTFTANVQLRVAVLPGSRDARRQRAAVRPAGWRFADRRPRAVDLGDDARRIGGLGYAAFRRRRQAPAFA